MFTLTQYSPLPSQRHMYHEHTERETRPHMHVNADRHIHACIDKHTDAWPLHVALGLIMWAGVLGDNISIFVTSEVWYGFGGPLPTTLQVATPPATSLTLILPLVSVLQTDFEKDVDLACRSGERLTGESHGGQSAPLLLSLFPASVCPTCPHPTPAATWPSLGSIPRPPPRLQESCGPEPQKAVVEPMLGWDHLWYLFTRLSVPFPPIGQSR